jgi:hypothetical protein
VFAFGAADKWKLVAGAPPQLESVNTNPYFFPLANPLLISIA